MAEQTAAITQVIADAIREGDGEVVVAVQAGNAEVVAAISEMTRQMSELSDDIRALLAERPGMILRAMSKTDDWYCPMVGGSFFGRPAGFRLPPFTSRVTGFHRPLKQGLCFSWCCVV